MHACLYDMPTLNCRQPVSFFVGGDVLYPRTFFFSSSSSGSAHNLGPLSSKLPRSLTVLRIFFEIWEQRIIWNENNDTRLPVVVLQNINMKIYPSFNRNNIFTHLIFLRQDFDCKFFVVHTRFPICFSRGRRRTKSTFQIDVHVRRISYRIA